VDQARPGHRPPPAAGQARPRHQARLTQARRRPDALTLTTPDGWTVTTQPAPDFSVHQLRKLAILGAPAVSCGIYLGGHASYQSGIDNANVKTTPATLLRAPITWPPRTASGSRFTTEAITSRPAGARPSHLVLG
jgi:hypothetical protein